MAKTGTKSWLDSDIITMQKDLKSVDAEGQKKLLTEYLSYLASCYKNNTHIITIDKESIKIIKSFLKSAEKLKLQEVQQHQVALTNYMKTRQNVYTPDQGNMEDLRVAIRNPKNKETNEISIQANTNQEHLLKSQQAFISECKKIKDQHSKKPSFWSNLFKKKDKKPGTHTAADTTSMRYSDTPKETTLIVAQQTPRKPNPFTSHINESLKKEYITKNNHADNKNRLTTIQHYIRDLNSEINAYRSTSGNLERWQEEKISSAMRTMANQIAIKADFSENQDEARKQAIRELDDMLLIYNNLLTRLPNNTKNKITENIQICKNALNDHSATVRDSLKLKTSQLKTHQAITITDATKTPSIAPKPPVTPRAKPVSSRATPRSTDQGQGIER